ncbi:hypothetical protein [Arthrobacter sp. H14-L1]|uniref:hypothetical protein n=1 Tax=Arthrobacter sp. H14-L1 TaxID=2996697 RepID=UPI002270BC4C|nr:hypothetical protein [Arthrobacter sp. H14-L1]MCY0905963.1 hypothetical protein [Arthrobacter sp. H14-L1]
MPSRPGLIQKLRTAVQELVTGPNPQRQAERAKATLPEAISAAEVQVSGAKDFIISRPGAGFEARQQLAAAEAALNRANSAGADPVRALESAREAAELAQQSGRRAEADTTFAPPAGGGSGGNPGYGVGGYGAGLPGRRGSGGGGFAGGLGGGLLGGVLGGMLSGNRGFFGVGDEDGADGDWGDGDGGFSAGGPDNFGGDSGNFGGDSGNF